MHSERRDAKSGLGCCKTQSEEQDPFEEIDLAIDNDNTEIESIISCLKPVSRPVSEYVTGDDAITLCEEFDNDHWEVEFLSSHNVSSLPVTVDSENEDDYNIGKLPVSKVRNVSEAILNLEDVNRFLDSRGCCKEGTFIASAINVITGLQLKLTCEKA
uniref:Uncharacterized protein n=1 Tax=Amphimedon queenslandica TaxID=400682 RepID=A0A1X7VKG7_AMPQE